METIKYTTVKGLAKKYNMAGSTIRTYLCRPEFNKFVLLGNTHPVKFRAVPELYEAIEWILRKRGYIV